MIRIRKTGDNIGEHRCVICAENGEPLFVASEGYTERRGRDHAIDLLITAIQNGDYIIEGPDL